MHVAINGEQREIDSGLSVSDLLALLSIQEQRVAVEVNCDVVRREHRGGHILHEDDRIEIVSFVGGGI